jgi:hypothetical protein
MSRDHDLVEVVPETTKQVHQVSLRTTHFGSRDEVKDFQAFHFWAYMYDSRTLSVALAAASQE